MTQWLLLFILTRPYLCHVHAYRELIKIDRDWVPKGDGYSLYIRPTGISTHPYIGVGASLKAKIFIILSPVGPYYPGTNAIHRVYHCSQ